jgi:AbrB family looped-hinge helix DNA binding protein
MAIAHSKLTKQGQISVPAEVRRKLALGPGSTIEWIEVGEDIVVRHSGRYSSDDIHRAIFPDGPPKPVTVEEMKASVGALLRRKHARR